MKRRFTVRDKDGLWGEIAARTESEARACLTELVNNHETELDLETLILTLEQPAAI